MLGLPLAVLAWAHSTPVVLAPSRPAEEVRLEEVELTVDLSAFADLEDVPVDDPAGQARRRFTGRLGETSVLVELFVLSNAELGISIPEHVMWMAEDSMDRRLKERRGTATEDAEPWTFDREHFRVGPYGWVPYALVGEKLRDDSSGRPQSWFCMAGVAREHSYTVEVHTRPPLGEEQRTALLEALFAGVRYDGDTYDRAWTDEEARARWAKDVPEDIAGDLDVLRTKHFIILTNSSGKKKFASEVEKSYDKIRELYPFEEMKELRLLPILLFRTPDEYYAFCGKVLGWGREEAASTKGVAFRDVYATWYEAPKDPVHIHEITHQIFRNRLRLTGGGSWFQEGVAEYICTSATERKAFRRVVKAEHAVPLSAFVGTRSLIEAGAGEERVDGTDPAEEAYLQAACLIEYVHEAREYKGEFLAFVHGVGAAQANDREAIDGALQDALGTDLATFEKGFLEYWLKR